MVDEYRHVREGEDGSIVRRKKHPSRASR